jgi:hypothetical protein
MKIYLDIETIPTQRPEIQEHVKSNVKAPGNYKDPAKIAAYIENNADNELRKTALAGLFGEVWCIGWAKGDDQPRVSSRQALEESEAGLLRKWYAALRADDIYSPVWVGHNVMWDLRFLWQRSIVHGIRPTVDLAIDAKPYDDVVRDTMVLWSGIRDYVSLDNLCFSLGIATKGDLDGSLVWDYVQDGRWQEVAEYCADDVERARLIYQRISLCEL